MNKLPKEKREKLMLVGMGTLVVLAALYMLVVSAQHAALREYATKIEDAKEKLAKAERWQRMAPTIEAKLTAGRAQLDAKQADMAPVDKFKWFYNTLEGSLEEHKVQLVDITREPEIGDVGVLPKFPFKAATFGVKLLAPFHDFGAFLADFENRFPYMRVQNVEIEPDTSKADASDAAANQLLPANRSESLGITIRVVTLVKPNTSL